MNNSSSANVKLVLFGITLLMFLVVGWFLVISPKRQEAASLSQEILDIQGQIQVINAELQAEQAPAAAPIRIADLFKLSRAMPDRADIPSVLLQLTQISAETGISFQSITPHDPVPFGAYEQIGIELVFEGHFYDLSDFLFRLRNLVSVHHGVLDATGRLFTVDAIAFDEGELSFPQVKATLTVSAYVFGDGIADPPPAEATQSEAAPAPVTPATPPATEGSQPIPAAPAAATATGA